MRRMWIDLRLWALLLPALAVLAIDMPVALTLLYSMSAIFVLSGLSHLIRKLLFPYADLEYIMLRASEAPTGAGMIFLGVSLTLSAIILAAAIWVSK